MSGGSHDDRGKFAKGNQVAVGHEKRNAKMVTSQLISVINEIARDKTGRTLWNPDGTKKTKLRKAVEQLVDNAQHGDLRAMEFITDRLEGKPKSNDTMTHEHAGGITITSVKHVVFDPRTNEAEELSYDAGVTIDHEPTTNQDESESDGGSE